MSIKHVLQLILLAAIWGGSFLFIRIGALEIAAIPLVEIRLIFAAGFLLLLSFIIKRHITFLKHWRYYFTLGLLNTAIPFSLFAYAAQTLNSSTLSILNCCAAIWSSLISFVIFKEEITPKKVVGLLLGIAGVAVLIGWESKLIEGNSFLPILAALTATLGYAISSHYSKRKATMSSYEGTHGSLWMGFLILLPFGLWQMPSEMPSFGAIQAIAALGVFCTAIAFVLYFQLINDVGPTPTLSVMFMVPFFGMLWGWLFLDEQLGLHTLLGAALILAGTSMVTGFSLQVFRSKPE